MLPSSMPSVTREQIRAFLNRVATDEEYRAQLMSDPVATLAAEGFAFSEEEIPRSGITLPSNEYILDNLEALTDKLCLPRLCLVPFII